MTIRYFALFYGVGLIALGVSGFMVMAIMLSLLIFIGEAVRDAFDPRRAA